MRQSCGDSLAEASDGRKQRIRGLWIQGEKSYAQLAIENAITGTKRVRRVPLADQDNQPADTTAQAVGKALAKGLLFRR